MKLGGGGLPGWQVQRFIAAAATVTVASGQTIQYSGSSCKNQRSQLADRCDAITRNWPIPSDIPGTAAKAIAGMASDSNIAFDVVIASQHDLVLMVGARVFGASIFLCSGDQTYLGGKVALDSSGQACGAGEGTGNGTTNKSASTCGGGGGSHLGQGGKGV